MSGAERERAHGTLRRQRSRECLDRLLIFNRRQLERIDHVYVRHYNSQRPHRALDLQPPDPSRPPRGHPAPTAIRRRDILAGIIHEYEAVAA